MEAALRSKFKKDPTICNRQEYSHPKIVKYFCKDPKEGYMFNLIENNDEKLILHE